MHVIEMVLVTGYGGHPPGHCLVARMGYYMFFIVIFKHINLRSNFKQTSLSGVHYYAAK